MRSVIRRVTCLPGRLRAYLSAQSTQPLPPHPAQGASPVELEETEDPQRRWIEELPRLSAPDDALALIRAAIDNEDVRRAAIIALTQGPRQLRVLSAIPEIVHQLARRALKKNSEGRRDDAERLIAGRIWDLMFVAIPFETAEGVIYSAGYVGGFDPLMRHWIHEGMQETARRILARKENTAMSLHYLTARGQFKIIDDYLDAECVRNYRFSDLPYFLLASFTYSDRRGRRDLKVAIRERLRRLAPEDLKQYEGKLVDQLTQRANAIDGEDSGAVVSAGRSNQQRRPIFIGIFGQMRYQEHFLSNVLPNLRCAAENRGLDVTFAISTWSRTGQHELFDWVGADFLVGRLPPDVGSLVLSLEIATIGDFKSFFPNVAALTVNNNIGHEIDRSTLLIQVGDGAYLNISTEEEFQTKLVEHGIDRLEIEEPRLNQVRMFDRLDALGKIAAQYNEDAKNNGAAYFFIRPDVEAAFDRILEELLQLERNDVLLVDHDDQAEFIEGIGDRYFGGGFAAIEKLSETFAYLGNLAKHEDWRSQRDNIVAHRFIAKWLFRSDVAVRSLPADRFPRFIYRGSIHRAEILDALQRDLDSPQMVSHRDIQDKVAAFLGNCNRK